ncbi:chromodomain helicase [Pseudovirgaria hyperparasitica]|uniref:Chromodomain helicase n=1 Tax=Pseudovirgaria hyperparasitica TaxID=470096 RepID=A0A6A6WI50_9PEZI|nr:chromodomain helicase [Pseudovirgaria hyperparasitica]KAF2761720.1 chromodomain helicase [Pseudovirgaria hyperparasitica]
MDSGAISQSLSRDFVNLEPHTNGFTNASSIANLSYKPMDHRSESDLSDINDAPGEAYSSEEDHRQSVAKQEETPDAGVASSEDEDAEGEDDADYDMESPSPEPPVAEAHSPATSEDSRRSMKRKATDEDDEDHMRNNPELFGLRRSGRANQRRRVVDSSDEDSGSDAVSGPARKKRRPTAPARVSNHATPVMHSTADSDSESDDVYVNNKKHILTKKQRRRQMQVAAGLAPPSQAEVRFSTRRAAKVQTYNEDEEDPLSELESDALTPNYWVNNPEQDSTGVDVVLKHRLKEGVGKEDLVSKQSYEFNIKWNGRAHYHASWETFASLNGYRGYRKLENYWRKIVMEEVRILEDPDVSLEEKEAWHLDRERDADMLEDYQQVERVIGIRDDGNDTEYYVKWKGLQYESSTWEDAKLISELSQKEIDRYLDRSSQLPVSKKSESAVATRKPHQTIKTQPDYIKHGELREFQLRGINFLAYHWCKGNNVILADEMGLGKTVQTVSFMNWLRHDRDQQGPFLVVVPLSTLPAWADTFNNWTPDLNYVVYNGNEPSRKIIREYELLVDNNPKRVKFNALLTTYEFILADSSFLSQVKWQFLAVDEAHRLKNRDSQLYLRLMDFNVPSRLLITGTPMQNTLSELSALMDFLMPGKVTVEEDLDLQSEDASRKIKELSDAISPYMIRRTKSKVENDLPPKTEKIIRVELSDIQLEYYKNILTRNYTALNAGVKGPKQSLLNIMMELKKASNHPFMFPNVEERLLENGNAREDQLRALITSSGKMMLLDQLLTKLKKDNHRVLIFSQMVQMLNILGDYLQLRGHQYQRLDGTIASGPRRMAIDHFNAPESKDFCFLLSTRAGGLGINLMTADTVILFDSDWNPQADLQAMARAHRIGQKKPVSVYRLVSKDTVEEEVLERARNKLMLEFITIQRGVTDKDATDFREKLSRAGHSTAEPTSSDDINRILKRRGQKMFEQTGNQKRLEELDIDAVLENAEEHQTEQATGLTSDGGEDFLKSFEYTDVKIDLEWDEIIPKEHLDIIKAEEKKKEDEKYLAEVIEQNAPRKRKAPSDEREQRAAKKRARQAAIAAAAEDASDDDSGPDQDPNRPLSEKETRNLIRAYEKWGSLSEKGEEMVKDAKLVGRNIDLLHATMNEVVGISQKLLKEEQDKLDALEREANKVLTKKDRKAVLFDYRGVKRINAETITERPHEMRMLKEVIGAVADHKAFRITEASKPAHYTCPWGAREDGMLCVGIMRHGYGAWTAIRDDPDLALNDKFFLEEHRVDKKEERNKGEEKNAKSPGAVHLVRRANYLMSVLKDKTSNGTNLAAKRALENHHRNNKKWSLQKGRQDNGASVSASPAPHSNRKREPEKSRHRAQSNSDHRKSMDRRMNHHSERNGTPEIRRKPSGETMERPRQRVVERTLPQHNHGNAVRGSGETSTSEKKEKGEKAEKETSNSHGGDKAVAVLFTPIQDRLNRLKGATKQGTPEHDQRLKILKIETLRIGEFITELVKTSSSEALEDRYWAFVVTYWPNKKISNIELKKMYKRLRDKELEKDVEKKSAMKSNGSKEDGQPSAAI